MKNDVWFWAQDTRSTPRGGGEVRAELVVRCGEGLGEWVELSTFALGGWQDGGTFGYFGGSEGRVKDDPASYLTSS